MKKLTLILVAFALTFGFSQCKKQETPTADEGVFITLKAGYGNGAKTDFDPATGAFVWTADAMEYIYVGGSNHDACLGVLSGTGTGEGSMTFSGTLTTTPTEGETLHFFYLGKGRNGSPVSTLDFSTQDGTLANVTNYHIAIGDGSYSSSTINYATTLNMAMAIAYFDVNSFKNANDAAETVYLHGDEVYSTATIDYTNGTITGNAKGYINLGTASNGKYVALIPSVSTETTLKFDSNSKWGAMNFMRGIQAGRYYANSSTALTVTAGALLEGTVPGLFSVSDTKMVRFSKGNLQYIGSASTPYWRFADNQWDYLGTTTSQNSTTITVDRDLFGWGTSGYNHGATCYQPWSTDGDPYKYYAYGVKTNNLYDSDGKADWGYNAINNGGNTVNSWRTLIGSEWDYVFNTRKGHDSRWGHSNVNGVNGMILLPDDWMPLGGVPFTPGSSNWANVYNSGQWAQMEAKGAVFLPAAGWRSGTSIERVEIYGNYWSSSYSSSTHAYKMYFYSNYLVPQGGDYRSSGYSVRLVHNAGLIVNTDIVNDVTAGGSIFSGWTNDGDNPWDDPTPGSGGNTLGGWNNDGNNPWGN